MLARKGIRIALVAALLMLVAASFVAAAVIQGSPAANRDVTFPTQTVFDLYRPTDYVCVPDPCYSNEQCLPGFYCPMQLPVCKRYCQPAP